MLTVRQIYKNYASKSVEGLSFVFLLQWTIGDLTNFIGAFLTKQLPIQIVIAAYMLIVDLTLCAQFASTLLPRSNPVYYHKEPTKRRHLDMIHEQTPLLVTQHRHSYRRRPVGSSRSTRGISRDSHPGLYRTNSVDPWYVYRVNTSKKPGKRSQTVDRAQRGLHRSYESLDPSSKSNDTGPSGSTHRGRSRESKAPNHPASENVYQEAHLNKKRRLKLQPSMSRRGSNMILLGMGMLMTAGPWSWSTNPVQQEGSVSPTPSTLAIHHYAIDKHTSPALPSMPFSSQDHLRHPILLFVPTIEFARQRHERKKLPLSMLMGRIFAWFCTVLYMTSRLPQIWANYKRKSVHGLSWLLFLLAFLANLLYSLSILSNPKAVGPFSRQFLSESLPFLIGSGGTLVFDLIILIQYWMWHDRSSTKEGTHDEA